jgi:hypothetical protein
VISFQGETKAYKGKSLLTTLAVFDSSITLHVGLLKCWEREESSRNEIHKQSK